VSSTATVDELKQAIETTNGAKASDQKLIFKGKILKDNEVLNALKVEDGSTLHMVVSKPIGGQSQTGTTSTTGTTRTQ